MIAAIRSGLRGRLLLALVTCALLVRVAIPAGWMPDASAKGFDLVLCSGTMDAPVNFAIPGVLKAALEKEHPAPDPAHKVPCDFAAVGHAADLSAPAETAYLAEQPAPPILRVNRLSPAPGRGLAAPPPPPTGPPAA